MEEKLRSCVLFSGLSAQAIAELLPLGRRQTYAKGQVLLAPRQRLDQLSVVVDGCVQLFHLFADGQRSLLGVVEQSEVFGAELVCTPTRLSPYHAVCSAHTTLLSFPAEVFLQPGRLSEATRQTVCAGLLKLVANENVKKDYRLAILSQNGLRARIWTYLTMQADKRGQDSFAIPFSREDLASFLCVNRSALSHELSKMEKEGLILFRKNQFTVLKRGLSHE